jgi:hypothetical protein
MLDGFLLSFYSALTPMVGMWYVGPLLVSRPRGIYLRLALVFLAFFVPNLYCTVECYALTEALLRSAGVGLMPLVVGYVWARYGLPHLR